ncbi:MAG: hypothetical protein ACOC95_07895 [Planctomycetota bacterium]
MDVMIRCLSLLILILPATAAFAADAPGNDVTVYHIGNSLVRGLSLDRMNRLFEAAAAGYAYGSQLGGGVKLYEHLARRRADGRRFKTNNLQSAPFGSYDQALQKHTFDALVLQPHGYWLNDRHADNAVEKGDLDAASAFIRYATGDNPAGHKATGRVYLYGTWPRIDIVWRRTDLDADGDGVVTFADFWNAPYDPAQNTPRWTTPSRDFLTRLVTELNERHGDLAHSVRLIPVGDVFAELDKRIRAGDLPGIEAYCTRHTPLTTAAGERPSNLAYYREARRGQLTSTPLDPASNDTGFVRAAGIANLYADRIHMNDQPHNGDDDGTLGAYVAALTFYSTLTGRSPVGLTSAPWERLDPVGDARLIRAVQETVWQVVRTHPLTGVTAEADESADRTAASRPADAPVVQPTVASTRRAAPSKGTSAHCFRRPTGRGPTRGHCAWVSIGSCSCPSSTPTTSTPASSIATAPGASPPTPPCPVYVTSGQ